MTDNTQINFPPEFFTRLDDTDDSDFYQLPRFVTHIDDKTIGALTAYYRETIFAGADVLDLMSSWISHLPDDLDLGRVSGLGLNTAELEANPRLSDFVVHNLNAQPKLPYDDATYDFVLIAVSIQYLIRPLEVFKEIARVLRRPGQVIVATSHRCFPTKAIRAFQQLNFEQRLQFIGEYMRRTPHFSSPVVLDRSPVGADPLWLVNGQTI